MKIKQQAIGDIKQDNSSTSNNNLYPSITDDIDTIIPEATAPILTEEEQPFFVYKLDKDVDNLTRLAIRFHCTEEDIKILNNMLYDDLDLYDGNTIIIPKTDISKIDLSSYIDTKEVEEKKKRAMAFYFSRNNKISTEEARVYLEMNEWDSRLAQQEFEEHLKFEKQHGSMPSKYIEKSGVKVASDTVYIPSSSPSNQSTVTKRKVNNSPYVYELMETSRK
ncbi:hypothetical protein ABK040_008434 [Willaertia magna]